MDAPPSLSLRCPGASQRFPPASGSRSRSSNAPPTAPEPHANGGRSCAGQREQQRKQQHEQQRRREDTVVRPYHGNAPAYLEAVPFDRGVTLTPALTLSPNAVPSTKVRRALCSAMSAPSARRCRCRLGAVLCSSPRCVHVIQSHRTSLGGRPYYLAMVGRPSFPSAVVALTAGLVRAPFRAKLIFAAAWRRQHTFTLKPDAKRC